MTTYVCSCCFHGVPIIPRRANVRKTAKEIVTTVPGWIHKRDAIILALCQGQPQNFAINPAKVIGQAIVMCANQIIEEMYNG